MRQWEQFEIDCADYIQTKYGSEYGIKAIAQGGSDSNLNDINIFKNDKFMFNVEAKGKNAQSGQFVVKYDIDFSKYIYGKKNFSLYNAHVESILVELNKSKEYLKNIKKTIKVDIPNNVSANWIKEYYKSKDVKYFISEFSTEKIIVHIDNFDQYFDITCNLRPKKSGSANIARTMVPSLHKALSLYYPDHNIKIENLEFSENKRLLLKTNSTLFEKNIEKPEFDIGGITYRFQLTKEDDTTYYIRKLSSTANPTVIFQIASKISQQPSDLSKFINDLKQ